MSDLPNCPKCDSEYVYQDDHILICPECSYEWSADTANDIDCKIDGIGSMKLKSQFVKKV